MKVAKQLGLTSLLSIDVDKVCNVCGGEGEGGQGDKDVAVVVRW